MRRLLVALALFMAAPTLAPTGLAFAAAVAPASTLATAEEATAPKAKPSDEAAVHTQLRALRDRLVAGVNAKNPDAILADLDDDILFTAMNNEVVNGKDDARAYYAKMLVGSQRIVKDMSLTVEVDDLSILLADGEVAMAAGSSVAAFDMMVGDSFEVPLRWTATLNNTENGWKVASIHFSANMFDNPLMSGFKTFAYVLAGGLGALGLLLGWLIGRRRKRA